MEDKYLTIHGKEWKYEDVAESIEWAMKQVWKRQEWKQRAALVSDGKLSDYVGQKYDPDKEELIENGWEHDHCEICWWTINESSDPEKGQGYTTNGHSWICVECYEQLIEGKE